MRKTENMFLKCYYKTRLYTEETQICIRWSGI